jgi:L-fucose isomerase-like protein
MANKRKMTMGVIVGNRGFFPHHLAMTGREEMIQVLQQAGMDVVVLGPEQSKYGAVETYDEARRCAELFKPKADTIDGVIVTLPNFGDERAIADTLRLSRLDLPVLVQATPDTPSKMAIAQRRDSFCGKMSACP